MRKAILWSAGLAILLTLPWLPAQAQSDAGTSAGAEHWNRLAERFDADGDGRISAEEFNPGAKRFTHFDTDGDGALTESDFENFQPRAGRHDRKGRVRMALAADADRSGDVTADEWRTFLSELDADGDGIIAEDEVQAHREARMGDGASLRGRRGPQSRSAGLPSVLDRDGDGAVGTDDLQTVFAELDRDGDGALSRAELPRGQRRSRGHRPGGHLVKMADINEDGQVTLDEWNESLAALDADGDGQILGSEIAAAAERRGNHRGGALEVAELSNLFETLDANADGVITEDEVPRRPRRGHRGGGPGGPSARN